ncbi:Uncharacterised protein [uncultured archaeon]|nr:Uncharacterised protein [uncultured archaeon]
MNSLAQARTLGGIGSILILLGIVPIAGVVLFIVGFIMVLMAVKYISETVEDKTIFNNMLIAVILAIVGMIAGLAVAIAGRPFPFFREFRPLYGQSMFIEPGMFPFFTTLVIALVIVWVFYIGSAIFLRKSYTTVASKLDISMFDTVALFYLIGAVLAIILVGFIVIYVAEILQTVAFFSIVEKPQQPLQA